MMLDTVANTRKNSFVCAANAPSTSACHYVRLCTQLIPILDRHLLVLCTGGDIHTFIALVPLPLWQRQCCAHVPAVTDAFRCSPKRLSFQIRFVMRQAHGIEMEEMEATVLNTFLCCYNGFINRVYLNTTYQQYLMSLIKIHEFIM